MSDQPTYPLDRETSSAEDHRSDAESSEARRRTATRADLVEGLSDICPSLSRNEARDVFEMALSEMSDALIRGEPVKLRSFGLFVVREKRERIGRNPRTGVEVPIKPRRVLTFKPSPVLLDVVNASDAKPADRPDRATRKKQ